MAFVEEQVVLMPCINNNINILNFLFILTKINTDYIRQANFFFISKTGKTECQFKIRYLNLYL